ncbi:hypothetical protein K491DRAFT_675436 [Lophiostoma macrostomum CBS 122681]|uniref:Uncharacterized protein n=1 Tax=Lophiostoma macrostomum CBS 122681 TaxID=1314788 RepID=A0A6A6TKI1_9PLEO|nr:hypothetical protein K491DRAFT_675436 [Lophiostoma macrostomum CBS 122681]
MSDLAFFSSDGSEDLSPPPPPPPPFPTDDFDVPARTLPNTIFYLTASTPHTDTFTIHGPSPTFAALLPAIQTASSSSPAAIEKLRILRADADFDFDGLGFTRFVVPLERGAFTLLQVVREVSEPVHEMLPGPVYTVTAHGPLEHDMGGMLRTVASGRSRGLATRSWIVGTWVDVETARDRARETMDGMLREESAGGQRITRSERMEPGGRRRWILLGMSARFVWEVKYEVDKVTHCENKPYWEKHQV